MFCVIQESCDIDATLESGLTALHVAAMKKKTRLVDFLVGYGAQLNITDVKGNTPLHLVLDEELESLPSADVTQILKVTTHL